MSRKIRKIWIAISTPFQVNFFYPLICRLKETHEFLITARSHDRIVPMLESKKLDFIEVGRHGGRNPAKKLLAYAETVKKLVPIVKREKPDILLTERWPEAVRTAFGLQIPAWALFYDEREYHVNRMVFPLSSKIFAPSFYSMEQLRSNGVIDLDRVVRFNGFHTCYLKGYSPVEKRNPFKEIGLNPPIVLVRPEPERAAFFGEKKSILEDTIKILVKENDANIAVAPRTPRQKRRFGKYPVTIYESSSDENPVAYSDVVIGAAETMLMESFVLGIPTVSAVYWEPSAPVKKLHTYVPHYTEPPKIAMKTESYLLPGKRAKFEKHAAEIVRKMDNPIDAFMTEIKKIS